MEWYDRVLAKRDDVIPSFVNVDAINSYVDKSMQLDQPEMTGTETAADIALGFAPGIGTAMGFRDFERARRDDDKLGMGLGLLSMIPVAGGAVKAGRKGVNRIIDELDMSSAARMKRAKEMGFDTSDPVYHGTSTDFDAFDPDRAIGTQFWSTNDKSAIEAGEVGAQGKGVIKEMFHRVQNPAGWDEYDKFGTDELIAMGYDGVKLPDSDGKFTIIAFDPAQYRDVNAAFDPAKKDSANLLAGLGAFGLGVGGAASMLTPQPANASDEPWYEKVLNK